MIRIAAAIAVIMLAACADRPAAPVVWIRDPGGDPTLHAEYLNAAAGWAPLGFDFTFDDPGLPACADTTHRAWRAGDPTDCEIVVWLFRVPNLVASDGTRALYDPAGHAINIDDSLTGWELDKATAHEMGHAVLATGTHTNGGIMGGADDRMWDVDRALACTAIGVCL